MGRAGRGTVLFGSAVIVLTLLVYVPALRNGFVNWDDDIYVTDNPAIRDLHPGLLRYSFLEFHAANWHPLAWLSHAADVAIWGLDPAGHHLTSILLHAANALLVFLLALGLLRVALGGTKEGATRVIPENALLLGAGVTGLLFGLHPVHVESAAWIAERKDLLSAFFYLASLLTWMSATVSRAKVSEIRPGSPWTRGASLLLYALALLSKPMAVTLPAVLAVLYWYPLRKLETPEGRRAATRTILPYAGLAVVVAALAVLAQREGGSVVATADVGIAERLLVAANAILAYLGKLLVPVNLLPFYPHPRGAVLGSFRHLLAAAAVVGITAASLRVSRRQPWWAAAWAGYLVMLAPVLGIVQAGGQAMADRYMYLPSIPPFLLVGAGVAAVAARLGAPSRRGLVAAMGAVLVALAMLSIRQIGIWRSSIDLWTFVLDREPNTIPLAYYNRGQAHLAAGATGNAIADYSAAISLNPGYREAFHNRAVAFERSGDIGRAVTDYRETVRLDPSDPLAHNSLGVALAKSGNPASAVDSFSQAIRLAPALPSVRFNRGLARMQMGDMDQAARDFQAACELGMAASCERLDRTRPGPSR